MSWFAENYPDEISKLRALYGEPHRAYHTWEHIEALLDHFVRLDWSDQKAVEVAIYYHDAIYQPLSATNEADSAAMMMADLQGRLDPQTLQYAESIILATAGHQVPEGASPGLTQDCALFLDMDLSILGAPADAFEQYDAAIRQEFIAIPDDIFLPRRRGIMAGFLERPRLFLTDTFHRTHDAPARENLRRLVKRLSETRADG